MADAPKLQRVSLSDIEEVVPIKRTDGTEGWATFGMFKNDLEPGGWVMRKRDALPKLYDKLKTGVKPEGICVARLVMHDEMPLGDRMNPILVLWFSSPSA